MQVGDPVRMVAPWYADVPRDSLGLIIEIDTTTSSPFYRVVFPNVADWFLGIYLEVIQ